MTEIGSVYCAICWDYYYRVIYVNQGKIACKVLVESLCQRRNGTATTPPLSTAELRQAVKKSGKTYCPVCFSTDVAHVTAYNHKHIQENLPVDGLNMNSEA